jgi:hypothetical protein
MEESDDDITHDLWVKWLANPNPSKMFTLTEHGTKSESNCVFGTREGEEIEYE